MQLTGFARKVPDEGSCHCGVVQYEIKGEVSGFKHCHCHTTPRTSCHQGGGESLDATGVLRCSTQAS
jgi:hypothetical protein